MLKSEALAGCLGVEHWLSVPEQHLGSKTPARSPSVRERLNAAYLAATNSA